MTGERSLHGVRGGWIGRCVRAARWYLGAGALLLVAALGYFQYTIHRPLDFGPDPWSIERGEHLSGVIARMAEQGIIRETVSLRLLARMDGRGRHIQAGTYRFPPRTTPVEFLDYIVSGGAQVGFNVTIIEGWTFRDMREHLRNTAALEPTTAAMTDAELMAALGHPALHPEGRFFPDTYTYIAGAADLSVYRSAFELMERKLAAAWAERAEQLEFDSPEEAIIMASIIEKESQVAEDQRMIAGVFHNRLRKGMRLQADPTVIYGLGQIYHGDITRAHLRTDTPYNTYTRGGLPPTPISLPGEGAIRAALNPAATDAYYFVSKGGGEHQFSVTLKEHNKAVREYNRRQKRG